MKQQEVFKKIGAIIKELNDQYEYLKTVDGALNELELELFLANSHFLADHVIILGKLNTQLSAVQKTIEKPAAPPKEKYFEPLVQAPAKNQVENTKAEHDIPTPQIDLESSTGDNFEFIRDEEPETIRHELILDEADWEDEDEPYVTASPEDEIVIPPVPEKAAPIVQKEQPNPVVEEVIQKAITAVKEEPLTINDRMSAQKGESRVMADQLYGDSISDLKQAITLNDKLLFIKELFNGYNLAYSEAIEILNRFSSFDEADLFLKKNYVVKNTWDSKPETSAKFYALLKRRYA